MGNCGSQPDNAGGRKAAPAAAKPAAAPRDVDEPEPTQRAQDGGGDVPAPAPAAEDEEDNTLRTPRRCSTNGSIASLRKASKVHDDELSGSFGAASHGVSPRSAIKGKSSFHRRMSSPRIMDPKEGTVHECGSLRRASVAGSDVGSEASPNASFISGGGSRRAERRGSGGGVPGYVKRRSMNSISPARRGSSRPVLDDVPMHTSFLHGSLSGEGFGRDLDTTSNVSGNNGSAVGAANSGSISPRGRRGLRQLRNNNESSQSLPIGSLQQQQQQPTLKGARSASSTSLLGGTAFAFDFGGSQRLGEDGAPVEPLGNGGGVSPGRRRSMAAEDYSRRSSTNLRRMSSCVSDRAGRSGSPPPDRRQSVVYDENGNIVPLVSRRRHSVAGSSGGGSHPGSDEEDAGVDVAKLSIAGRRKSVQGRKKGLKL